MPAPLEDSVDAAVVAELASRFELVADEFDARGFTDQTVPLLDGLELEARIDLIACELWRAPGRVVASAAFDLRV